MIYDNRLSSPYIIKVRFFVLVSDFENLIVLSTLRMVLRMFGFVFSTRAGIRNEAQRVGNFTATIILGTTKTRIPDISISEWFCMVDM
jgi:hypothetical protein